MKGEAPIIHTARPRSRWPRSSILRGLFFTLCYYTTVFLGVYTYQYRAWREHNAIAFTTGQIKWHSCFDKTGAELEGPQVGLRGFRHVLQPFEITFDLDIPEMVCTRISVPLTYEVGDERTISIPLARRRANATRTGPPIFLNPGGPGGSGMEWLLKHGLEQEYVLFNGSRDFISFDPRGVNGSIPAMSCYPTPERRLKATLESGGLIKSAADSIARLYASNQVLGSLCDQYASDIGPYISTYYVAHDMRFMASKIYGVSEQNVKIDYWGFSYGTILGMTFATLFPANIGNFVLDGVVQLYDYYQGNWESLLKDTKYVNQHFYDACAAHPESCPLAVKATEQKDGSIALNYTARTADEIEGVVDALLQSLKKQPLASDAGLVTYTSVKSYMVETIYKPAQWPALSTYLDELHHGNTSNAKDHMPRDTTHEGGLATACGDSHLAPARKRGGDIEYVRESVGGAERVNAFMADWLSTKAGPVCQFYPFKPVTIHTNRSSPVLYNGTNILFASLEFDLVTPVSNAVAMQQIFEESHLVITNSSYGHCSNSLKSSCANAIIAQWLHGDRHTRPTTECEVDEGHGAFETASRHAAPMVLF